MDTASSLPQQLKGGKITGLMCGWVNRQLSEYVEDGYKGNQEVISILHHRQLP